jgi:hypothetical protein
MSLFALAGLALTACGDDDTTTAKGVEADVADVADATVEEHEYAYEVTGTLPSGGTLRVRNTGKEFHMMGLGKLKAGKTFDDAKAALFSDDQADDGLVYDQVAMPGHFTAPGSDVRVTLPSLEPGTYMMACFINVAGEETAHFTRGMVNQIEVVAGDARAPKPDATYVASKGKAMTGPATLKAGRRVLKIEAAGDGAGDLEPGIFMINPGTTVEQFGEALKFFDEGPLPVDAASRVPGRIIIGMFDFGDQPAVYLDVDFDPGSYVLTAEDSDVENTPTVPVEMIQITVS